MSQQSTLVDTLQKLHFKLGDASPEYIDRRKKQMMLFLAAAGATIFTSRFAYRTTVTRQYIPTLFQAIISRHLVIILPWMRRWLWVQEPCFVALFCR